MSEPAQNDPPTPRGSPEVLDSRVTASTAAAVESSEARDTELDAGLPPEPERTPVAGALAEPGRPEHDTLLSAPRPADRLELVVEDKLAGFEMRLDRLEARLETVERRKAAEPEQASGRWWIWVFFLLALAVAWRALEALK
jgi:hypothetical protein